MTKETNIREIILDALLEIMENGGYSHLVLKDALNKYMYLPKQDRAFITRVTEGTVERQIFLDAVLNRYSKTKVNKMKPVIRTLLRMSVYQIFFMERVPDRAVCNEAVKLARKRKFDGLSGFVNGVLRTISREKDSVHFEDLSIRTNMPQFLLDHLIRDYGEERAEKIAEAFLRDRGLTVRCNLSLRSRDEIAQSLRSQGIDVTVSDDSDRILFLRDIDMPDQIEAFQNGWITVQDLSSSLVGMAAGIEKGMTVLDLCSAPGGKTLDAADRLMGTGMVCARDLTEYKVSLIEENLMRTGFSNVSVSVADARIFDPSLEEKADVMIADLPCSGLGILGKKPEIRFRITEKDMNDLRELQREILKASYRYVKQGGRLIYSTCTINKKENEENAAWIEENLPFERAELSSLLPESFRKECQGNMIQILPDAHPSDGFFISAFQRKKS